MQSQNEEDREEHRSKNRDRVRSYRQRKQHGITNIIAQNEPISLVGANNPFNGHMVLDHEQLHTMSNVPISHEYEVIAHKKFRERIDKFNKKWFYEIKIPSKCFHSMHQNFIKIQVFTSAIKISSNVFWPGIKISLKKCFYFKD